MKSRRFVFLLLVVTAVFALLIRSARAEARISFSFFHDSLEPHGEWLQVADYGHCWRPNGVQGDWSPYTDGYWTYTDAGWTWVSYEDWGSICYHYGRWVRVDDEGWCWVPDYEWGPAWVSWRKNDDYVGWAPLPPEARWERETGFSVWVDSSYDIGPDYYRFCNVRDFGAPVIRQVCFPPERNIAIIQNTVNITNISYNTYNDVIFNGGPDYAVIASRSTRPVPALKLVRNKNVNIVNNTAISKTILNEGKRGRRPLPIASQRGNQLEVFAPDVVRPVGPDDVKVKPGKVISKEKVNRGWAAVRDPELRAHLKQKMQKEAKGLTRETAPAKAVQIADLKAVPEKADTDAPLPGSTGKIKGGRSERGSRELSESAESKSGDKTVAADQSISAPDTGESNNGKVASKPSRKEGLGGQRPGASEASSSVGSGRLNSGEGNREGAKSDPQRNSRSHDLETTKLRQANLDAQRKASAQRHEQSAAGERPKEQIDHSNAQDAGRRREDSQREARRVQQEAAQQEAARSAVITQRRNQQAQAMQAQRRQQQQMDAQRQLARQQQLEEMGAARHQQRAVESHRAAPQDRAIESQRIPQQRQPIQIQRPPPQRGPDGGGGGVGGEGRGRGKREPTAEEAAVPRGR